MKEQELKLEINKKTKIWGGFSFPEFNNVVLQDGKSERSAEKKLNAPADET